VENVAEARKKAAEPLRTLGKDPETQGDVHVKDGRYGPYITDGKTNVSLPKRFTIEGIKLEEAVELLAKKRVAPKRAWRGKKKE
jgi:DNA topoisomerase-1